MPRRSQVRGGIDARHLFSRRDRQRTMPPQKRDSKRTPYPSNV